MSRKRRPSEREELLGLEMQQPEMAKVYNKKTGKYAGMQPVGSTLPPTLKWADS